MKLDDSGRTRVFSSRFFKEQSSAAHCPNTERGRIFFLTIALDFCLFIHFERIEKLVEMSDPIHTNSSLKVNQKIIRSGLVA